MKTKGHKEQKEKLGLGGMGSLMEKPHSLRGSVCYYIQLNRETVFTVRSEQFVREQPSVNIWGEKSTVDIFCTLSTFALEPEEVLAIPLIFTHGRLCHSHGPEALVLDIAVSMTTAHIYSGLHSQKPFSTSHTQMII